MHGGEKTLDVSRLPTVKHHHDVEYVAVKELILIRN